MPPRRILIVGSFAPSLIGFRGPLISSLIERNHAVVAAALDIDPDTAEALRQLGAECREIPLQNVSLNPLKLLGSIRAMRSLIRKEQPDLIIAYTIKPIIAGALASRAERVSTFVSLVTGAGYAFTGGWELPRLLSRAAASVLYRIALRNSNVIIFQNPDDESLFRRLALIPKGRDTHVVNGSGVDLQHFASAELPRELSFLMIARLVTDKGIREFARAVIRLKMAHPEVPVTLIGERDGSPHSLRARDLDELIRCGINYESRVSDVRPAIAKSSVYVLPSYREGTPRSVLEAMAMGRPIITTDAPGCRETVVDGVNGFLVPARDAESLYEAMLRFVINPNLAAEMGPRSRKFAEEKYDVRDVNANIMRYAGL